MNTVFLTNWIYRNYFNTPGPGRLQRLAPGLLLPQHLESTIPPRAGRRTNPSNLPEKPRGFHLKINLEREN